ncbi:hypothetical protein MRX96_054835 [Rhipicephalus microplus]
MATELSKLAERFEFAGMKERIAEADGKFIGTVEQCANIRSEHFVTVKINDQTLGVKVDTGAEVTVVGEYYLFLPPSLENAADLK